MKGGVKEGAGPAPRPVQIAIDGPSAAGKGTLARGLAQALGFAWLDTGLLYRATALQLAAEAPAAAEALRARGEGRETGPAPPEAVRAAARAAENVRPPDLANPALREEGLAALASPVAALAPVREALAAFQQGFAARPTSPSGAPLPGAVLDGRDIGTVILPEADLKLFVTASQETRARRRAAETGMPLAEARKLLAARDARDRGRAAAPLAQAADAVLLETDELGAKQALAQALAIARKHLGARLGAV